MPVNLEPTGGDRSRVRKVTPQIAREIHHLRKQGLIYKDIAKQVGLSHNCVRQVCTGQRWSQYT